MSEKTLICLEPWGGKGISYQDTGLGNRLIHWSVLYYISVLHGGCKILVQTKYWPELEFLELPNTESCNIDLNQVKNNYLRLSHQDIKDIIYERKLDIIHNTSLSYYSDEYIRLEDKILISGISKIKFKNFEVNKFFKDNFTNFCSIHLRRGFGTIPTVGFIKDFLLYKTKEDLKNYLSDYYFQAGYNPPSEYSILPDSIYFSVIDKILGKSDTQKFYISSDIDEKYYSYYFDRYSNNLIRREKYFEEFLSVINYDEKIDELYSHVGLYKYSLKQTLIDLFDIFVLSYSHTLIIDNYSTWSIVASLIGKKSERIDLMTYTLNYEGITYSEFVKKYSYYQFSSIKEKNNHRIGK